MEILNDFDVSVRRALEEIEPKYEELPGLVICGTHKPHDVEMMIDRIKEAREKGIPFLGICMGFELMLIEFARNILGMKRANSIEIDQNNPYPVFIKLPKLRVGIIEVNNRLESHWHNYFFNKGFYDEFKKHYLQMLFTNDILEIASNDSQIGVQFHPEYQSSKYNQHPILKEFIVRCHFTKDKSLANNTENALVKHEEVGLLGIKVKGAYLNIQKRLKIK